MYFESYLYEAIYEMEICVKKIIIYYICYYQMNVSY